MSEINELREEVQKLSKSRQWWIAVVSAIIAASASVVAAYYSYSAQRIAVDANRDISRTETAFDVYKTFGTKIIDGDEDQQCRALLLITAIEPQAGMKLINKELAKQINCDKQQKFTENIRTSLGSNCRKGRPTQQTTQTLIKLGMREKISEAAGYCGQELEIPESFEGPWPDGTISFRSEKVLDGQEVWCNCLPDGVDPG